MSSASVDLGANTGIGGGAGGVTSLNTQTGALTLVAGTNITITPGAGALTIASSGGTGGITSINTDVTAAQTLVVGTAGTNFAIVDNGTGQHTFNLPTSSAANRGALSSADWSTFNGKQASGNYITALTGDATASGPGSAAITLATVNGNVGSFTNANITVNAKGLITAASNGGASGITRSISSISSPTTAGAAAITDYVYFVSGTTTLTLPTAVGNTNRYTVKNTGVATVTIATTSAQTIDSSATASLPVSNTSLDLISDNVNWRVV